jgi:quercetin dioxygenase-like cupin family protein
MVCTRTFAILFGTLAATGILWAASQQKKPSEKVDPEAWTSLDAEIEKLRSSQSVQDTHGSPKVGGFIKTTVRYSIDSDRPFGAEFVSAAQAKYKEVAPGASMAVISGDPEKGAHRVFTKLVPGANFPLHTHTSEIHIVVIQGAYLYKPEKGEEKRVGPGCYLDIPAGDRHASGGDPKEGALFYQESSGKFDLVPVEPEKK